MCKWQSMASISALSFLETTSGLLCFLFWLLLLLPNGLHSSSVLFLPLIDRLVPSVSVGTLLLRPDDYTAVQPGERHYQRTLMFLAREDALYLMVAMTA